MSHVVVSGVPGSGKSTLAMSLAGRLGMPYLAMDPVKESLADELGSGGVERSRELGHAANEVVLSVAMSAPPSVLDSFWRHEWAVDRLGSLPAGVIEVFCECPPEVARQRYGARPRHPAHLDHIRIHDPDPWADHRARPLFDDALVVNTTADVDIDTLAARIVADPRWNGARAASIPTLIVVSGLPGTGKSTVAHALSDATGAAVFGRDVIGAALSRVGITPAGDPGHVAFALLAVMAEQQLDVGSSAILDSVGGIEADRVRWRSLAASRSARLLAIECVCSDERVHRERLEIRRRGIPGWYELTWADVLAARDRYLPWDGERLIVDAAEPLQANIAAAQRYFDAR